MSLFEKDDVVLIDGRLWARVITVFADRSPVEYELFASAVATPILPEYRLSRATEGPLPDIHEPWEAPFITPAQLRFAITHRRLTGGLSDTLLSFGSARIQILAHQFKPLLRLLDSPYRRLLIADEVGLGKTIEAGLILSEYELREAVDRVLILCPNALLHKWRDELDAKFGMTFRIWTRADFEGWLSATDERRAPDAFRAIVAMSTLADAGLVRRLGAAAPELDMLIVDEAHHLRNDTSQTHRAGEALAAGAGLVLFLSATPLHISQKDLFNLLHILLPANFRSEAEFLLQLAPNAILNSAIRELQAGAPNHVVRATLLDVHSTQLSDIFSRSTQFGLMIDRLASPDTLTREERVGMQRVCLDLNTLGGILTRTRKIDVAAFTTREPVTRLIPFLPEERAFYNAVTAFATARSDAAGGVPFGAQMYQRQVCSSTAAMRALLVGLDIAADRADEVDAVPDGQDEMAGYVPRSDHERNLLRKAVALGRALGAVDSKRQCLDELLEELLVGKVVERALVFSYFRRTLDYLEVHLSRRFKVGVLRGGMPLDERARVVRRFREGQVQILLSSEVGGEGLDFQFCNLLVNYDLPWNPMEVEQRIGRLDRFGQKHEKILIYNLLVEDTVEERIFGRLYERIGVFESAVGDMGAILGEAVRELTKAALNPRLTEQQRELQAGQLADQLVHTREDWSRIASERQSYIGSDQYLLDRFTAVRSSKAHISGEELRSYVQEGLQRFFPGSRLDVRAETCELAVDPELVREVGISAYGMGSDGRHRGTHPIRPLLRARAALSAGKNIPVTFDPALAFENSDLELLGPRHPYVQALASRAGRETNPAAPCAFVSGCGTRELEPGTYLLAVHEIEAGGLMPMRRLDVVAASLESMETKALSAGWLVTFLESAQDRSGRGAPPERVRLLAGRHSVEEHTKRTLRGETEELEARQSDILELRQGVLRAELVRKQQRIDEMLETLSDPSIRRLRSRELRNLATRCDEECARLADASAVSIKATPLAFAILEIDSA